MCDKLCVTFEHCAWNTHNILYCVFFYVFVYYVPHPLAILIKFWNSGMQKWKQLPAEVLGILPCKTITFKKRARKVIIELN